MPSAASEDGTALPAPAPVAIDRIGWRSHHRVVPSRYPPVDFFESYVDPDLLDAAYYVEGLTNDRLRAQAGRLELVPREDWLLGPGSSPVMAAFTHVGRESRFSDGSYGVYYAGSTIDTALAESRFHRERFLRYTREPPCLLTMRSYHGRIRRPLDDIRGRRFRALHDPEIVTWPRCQAFGARRRDARSWGLVYPSVRHRGGQCAAFLRPPAVGIPRQGRHYAFEWDGERIAVTFELRPLRS